MWHRLLFAAYYLRALPGVDCRHAVAAALARADVRLHQLRRQQRNARSKP
ncbi:hypothetical protein [Acidovorax sp.]|nr:hypothetical protein [Acidovorax sp.]MCE1194088.1 hypothetical protein [Acidovorax sp.]MCI5068449.1 hypothetical protein [Acidovorax sp.]